MYIWQMKLCMPKAVPLSTITSLRMRRGQLTSPIFVKGTKWGPDGSALKLTGNWDEVVSGLGLTAGILVEVCILSTYLAAERGVQAPGCAPRVIVTSITVVHGAQRECLDCQRCVRNASRCRHFIPHGVRCLPDASLGLPLQVL